MPTTYAIPNGRTVMDATTYTGNGSTQSIVNAAGFKPDFVWVKNRTNATSNILLDSVRGTDANGYLFLASDGTYGESTFDTSWHNLYGKVTALNSNGFTGVNGSTTGNINTSSNNYVAWQWQAGQGTTSSNTNGSITSTTSVNATAGFSVVTYTGTGANATVGHGLGVAPSMIITKVRSTTNGWVSWHTSLGGADKYIVLSNTNGTQTDTTVWNNTLPTSSVFSLGASVNTNISSATYVAYCWAAVAGFSAFGSYTANGSTDGPFIYCGFRPKLVLCKKSSGVGGWGMIDTAINAYNQATTYLQPNTSNAQVGGTSSNGMDMLSNGFKIRSSDASFNETNGDTYIYMAFAENPFKYSNAR